MTDQTPDVLDAILPDEINGNRLLYTGRSIRQRLRAADLVVVRAPGLNNGDVLERVTSEWGPLDEAGELDVFGGYEFWMRRVERSEPEPSAVPEAGSETQEQPR